MFTCSSIWRVSQPLVKHSHRERQRKSEIEREREREHIMNKTVQLAVKRQTRTFVNLGTER